MQCIACLFGLIVIVLIYGVFLAFWAPAGFLLRVKNKRTWFLSSIPVFLAMLIIYLLYQYWPTTVYERTFGFSPTADVTVYNSQDFYFADTGITYLKFTANQDTVKRIVNRGLILQGKVMKPCIYANDIPPGWWDPEITATTQLYVGSFVWDEAGKERAQQDFASERECLYYDPATEEAYFLFVGID